MAIIINLSAIHTLQPIHHGIYAFAHLCDKYANRRLSCCPSFFNQGANLAWTVYQYQKSSTKLIHPYKLGYMTTEAFLTGLLEIFSFMIHPDLKFSDEDIQRLNANKDSLYALKNLENPSNTDYAKALLEEAWNSIITFSHEDIKKIKQLFEKKDIFYFISNTNELNVFKILQELQNHIPNNIPLNSALSIIIDKDTLPTLLIGPNVYLVTSYLCHTYKTLQDNSNAQLSKTTPHLLEKMVKQIFHNNVDGVVVVSQYSKDLESAMAAGIENTCSADDYFQSHTLSPTRVITNCR